MNKDDQKEERTKRQVESNEKTKLPKLKKLQFFGTIQRLNSKT